MPWSCCRFSWPKISVSLVLCLFSCAVVSVYVRERNLSKLETCPQCRLKRVRSEWDQKNKPNMSFFTVLSIYNIEWYDMIWYDMIIFAFFARPTTCLIAGHSLKKRWLPVAPRQWWYLLLQRLHHSEWIDLDELSIHDHLETAARNRCKHEEYSYTGLKGLYSNNMVTCFKHAQWLKSGFSFTR